MSKIKKVIKDKSACSDCQKSNHLHGNAAGTIRALPEIRNPLFCDLIISHRCFFKCKMCIDWKTPANTHILTFDKCKQFIDGLSDFVDYKLHINIMGGEPFMLDWLLPLCEYIHEKGFNSIVTTNAYLIDRAMAKRIADSHLGILAISLDGMEAETHDFIRGKNGAYSRVIDALKYLKEYRKDSPYITILPLFLEKNFEELPELIKWTRSSGLADSISLLALVESGLVKSKERWFKQPEYKHLWPQDYNKAKDIVEKILSLKKEGYEIVNPFSQLEAFKEYYKDPEKFLRETEYCIHDYIIDLDPAGEVLLSGHLLGSLKNDMNLEKLWLSKRANDIRDYIDLHGCDNSRSCLINFSCAFKQDGYEVLDYYGNLAYSYQSIGKYDLALLNFNKSLKNNPNNAKLYLGTAYNYLKLKDYKAALREYNQAFKLDPDFGKEAKDDYENAIRGSMELDNRQYNRIC